MNELQRAYETVLATDRYDVQPARTQAGEKLVTYVVYTKPVCTEATCYTTAEFIEFANALVHDEKARMHKLFEVGRDRDKSIFSLTTAERLIDWLYDNFGFDYRLHQVNFYGESVYMYLYLNSYSTRAHLEVTTDLQARQVSIKIKLNDRDLVTLRNLALTPLWLIPEPGEHIDRACAKATDLHKQLEYPIAFNFNDRNILVDRMMGVTEAKEQFYKHTVLD